MSNGPGEPPSGPPTPPPSDPPVLPVSEGGLDSDDRMVIRVVEEFTETVEEANREQSRIVIVTAVVALVSAIAGPLVSLKINSDQIDSQRETSKAQAAALLESTHDQNDLEAARSESEFNRSERRVAYTDYLSTYNNSAVDLLEISGKYTADGYPPGAAARDLNKILDALKDVTRDFYTVTLVASADARDQASNSYAQFTKVANQLIHIGGALTDGIQLSAAQKAEINSRFQRHYQTLIQLSSAFIEQARKDLASNNEAQSASSTSDSSD
jgi:hypothetical protein